MGCGCGGHRSVKPNYTVYLGNKPMIGVKAQPIKRPAPQPPITPTRFPQQRRCPKCGWPMNSLRRFVPSGGRQLQIHSCMNRRCLYKEEKFL